SEPHDAVSLALRTCQEHGPTRGRDPAYVRTGHGRTVGPPILGVTMRILENRGGLAPHVGRAQPEMGGRRHDPGGPSLSILLGKTPRMLQPPPRIFRGGP